MAQKPVTDEQCREAVAAVRAYGTITAAAAALRMPYGTLYNRVRAAKARGYHTVQALARAPKHSTVEIEVFDGTVLVFSDAHYFPGPASTAHRGLLVLAKKLKPKAIICNGDAFDGASISKYPRIGWDNKPSVKEELEAVTERLGEIERAAPGAELIWPLGNHDSRFETYLASHAPQYEGIPGFHLKDWFPHWKPCWACFINSSVVVKHRFKGGIHSAHNNTLWAGKTIITGHDHMLKVTPFADLNGLRWGVNTGTLADPYDVQFADYTELNPVNWTSGFVVLTFRHGELLWPELAYVVGEGKLAFRGEVYEV